ncbi:hypothetical protein [Stenotrophomonas sp. 364]|uniref:hypothetical protein n=1 Tax=Stenotrophomonas sp. 364 TaxID=2691571 RepID=UPI001318B63E|nr:hypothetical protein [Stenotrophomonas sp. 364]QHB72090.1 hypothetical protein GQ674_12680 [Stenotrophomonas sp. 364]
MAKFSPAARLNSAALARLAAQVEGVSTRAIAQADTRAIVSVRRRFEPAAKKAVREVYTVRAGDLVGRFQIRSGADKDGEFLSLHASTGKLPLIGFGGRWGGRKTAGATAQIQLGSRKTYSSAFIATVNGQRRMLVRQFSRDSTAPSGRDPRNKLRTLTGPSAFQMVMGEGDAIAARLARQMNEYRGSELIRQLQLARKRKR